MVVVFTFTLGIDRCVSSRVLGVNPSFASALSLDKILFHLKELSLPNADTPASIRRIHTRYAYSNSVATRGTISKLSSWAKPNPCCKPHHVRSLRSQKTKSSPSHSVCV